MAVRVLRSVWSVRQSCEAATACFLHELDELVTDKDCKNYGEANQ